MLPSSKHRIGARIFKKLTTPTHWLSSFDLTVKNNGSFEALQFTIRAGFDGEQAANYSLPWQGLLGLAAPDFYGRGSAHFWGGWSRVEYGYVGVLTLFLTPVLYDLMARFTRPRGYIEKRLAEDLAPKQPKLEAAGEEMPAQPKGKRKPEPAATPIAAE